MALQPRYEVLHARQERSGKYGMRRVSLNDLINHIRRIYPMGSKSEGEDLGSVVNARVVVKPRCQGSIVNTKKSDEDIGMIFDGLARHTPNTVGLLLISPQQRGMNQDIGDPADFEDVLSLHFIFGQKPTLLHIFMFVSRHDWYPE